MEWMMFSVAALLAGAITCGVRFAYSVGRERAAMLVPLATVQRASVVEQKATPINETLIIEIEAEPRVPKKDELCIDVDGCMRRATFDYSTWETVIVRRVIDAAQLDAMLEERRRELEQKREGYEIGSFGWMQSESLPDFKEGASTETIEG
jgi:hypothetical protein